MILHTVATLFSKDVPKFSYRADALLTKEFTKAPAIPLERKISI